MAIEIFCPHCNSQQVGYEAQPGESVVCADANCGHSFIAIVEERSNSELDFSYDRFDAALMRNGRPTPLPTSRLRDTSTDHAAPTTVQRRIRDPNSDAMPGPCRFAMLGRTMLYCGLLILIAGAVFPATIVNNQASTGPTATPPEAFSSSMACTKLTIVVMGAALMITGAVTWSGSQTGPSTWDVVSVGTVLVLLVFSVFCFVGLTVAPRVL